MFKPKVSTLRRQATDKICGYEILIAHQYRVKDLLCKHNSLERPKEETAKANRIAFRVLKRVYELEQRKRLLFELFSTFSKHNLN